MGARLAAAAGLVVALVAGAALAQAALPEQAALATARADAAAARTRAAMLERQSEQARDGAEQARVAQAAVAARLQAAEADLTAAAAQLALADRLRRAQEQRLAVRQQPIARLVGALETMARRPPAAVLAQPGSLSDLVHVRAVLTSVMPHVATDTAALRRELETARDLRSRRAAALAELRGAQARRRQELQRLARLEVLQRRRAAALAGSAGREAERALALGEQARDIEDLVSRLERQATLRDALMALPGPLPRPLRPGAAPPPMPAAAVSGPPAYRLPVLGRVVRGFGDRSATGIRSRGITLAARPDAVVVAPAAGHIGFAGPYRGYDRIVIIDHGGGWTSLVTGLAAVSARAGDRVDQGSPIGRSGAAPLTLELRRQGEPVDVAGMIG
jgi:septal ring factor EnvC (AmiA/AmiB activator)